MSATQGARACFYNAEQIARALGGKRSAGGYIAKCPAHEDRRPSLSIREAGGRVLFKCFAGCSQESVLQALKEEGLWSIKPSRPHQAVIEATYVYNDELGRPLNRVCRTADKCFFQEHLVANGWIRGLGSRRVLYHLDEVLSRTLERVHVAEGEKDVDRLRSLGYLATCNPMGAGKWKEEYSAELAGRDVLIFFDNDSQRNGFAGQHHACQVALSLIGVGCTVRIAELPIGKDVSEYLDFGGSGACQRV